MSRRSFSDQMKVKVSTSRKGCETWCTHLLSWGYTPTVSGKCGPPSEDARKWDTHGFFRNILPWCAADVASIWSGEICTIVRSNDWRKDATAYSALPRGKYPVLPGYAGCNAGRDGSRQNLQGNCDLCHGADGSGDTGPGKAFHAKDLRSDEVRNQSDAALIEVITKGKGKMPAFGTKIKPEDITKMVAYIRSLPIKK